jgi:hypothetical protein
VVILGVYASSRGTTSPAETPEQAATRIADSMEAAKPPEQQRADSIADLNKRPITPAERVYLGASVTYLGSANKIGKMVAYSMAAAPNGGATLTDIKDSVEWAKKLENIGYVGDYQGNIKENVPPAFQSVANRIDEEHRLFQSAMTEYLEYFKDQNTDHINSGYATFKRSVLMGNAALDNSRAVMKKLKRK